MTHGLSRIILYITHFMHAPLFPPVQLLLVDLDDLQGFCVRDAFRVFRRLFTPVGVNPLPACPIEVLTCGHLSAPAFVEEYR